MLLEQQTNGALTKYLRAQGWIEADERVRSAKKPGEGNMNFVVRVTTSRRTIVLKQALPYVYRYPQVAAPVARGKTEAGFYQLINKQPELTPYIPGLVGFDAPHHVLALEDLGTGSDFTFLYRSPEQITEEQLHQLLHFLSHLHRIKAEPDEVPFLQNMDMRKLNHEHIFRYPYAADNGLDLDTIMPGLQAVSQSYQRNDTLRRRIAELGALYLRPGDTLVHGDFYPGSWLRVPSGVKVIDPEFGFFGLAAFDVGVMLAHALLTGGAEYTPERVMERYQPIGNWDESLAYSFAGAEVLRRILGLAQLPLTQTLDQRIVLLERAAALL
jgi:5-methylthioribose kinase